MSERVMTVALIFCLFVGMLCKVDEVWKRNSLFMMSRMVSGIHIVGII